MILLLGLLIDSDFGAYYNIGGRPSPMNTLRPTNGNRPRNNQHEDAIKRQFKPKVTLQNKNVCANMFYSLF